MLQVSMARMFVRTTQQSSVGKNCVQKVINPPFFFLFKADNVLSPDSWFDLVLDFSGMSRVLCCCSSSHLTNVDMEIYQWNFNRNSFTSYWGLKRTINCGVNHSMRWMMAVKHR